MRSYFILIIALFLSPVVRAETLQDVLADQVKTQAQQLALLERLEHFVRVAALDVAFADDILRASQGRPSDLTRYQLEVMVAVAQERAGGDSVAFWLRLLDGMKELRLSVDARWAVLVGLHDSCLRAERGAEEKLCLERGLPALERVHVGHTYDQFSVSTAGLFAAHLRTQKFGAPQLDPRTRAAYQEADVAARRSLSYRVQKKGGEIAFGLPLQ